MKLTWKKEPGIPGIQAPISHGGKKHDYVISHRRDEHTVSFRPPGKHAHVGTFVTEKEAKAAAATHARGSLRSHSTIQSCSVAKYLEVLSHELVRYDMATSAREIKRRVPINIYRLGHLMGALQRVREEVGNRTSDSEADKALFRGAMYGNFERDFPPMKKVVKQIEAGTCKIK